VNDLYKEGGYLANNPSWHAEDSPWKAKHILRMIEKNQLAPRTVCEVGCGAGEILAQLHGALGASCAFTGCEISPDAYAIARGRARPGLSFELKDLSKDPDARFDIILLIDVIEHLEDYFSFLRALKDKSRYKILHIPLDLSAQSVLRRGRLIRERDAVGHLHYFTEETALRTVEDSGYVVRDHFLTSGATEVDVHSTLAKAARYPRKLVSAISSDLAARLLGGFSVMVLAE
jgi:SAM-dependent methyltransferase